MKSTYDTTYLTSSFPEQSVSFLTKDTDDWKHACVDGVISMCNSYSSLRRSPAFQKRRNYNLFNNKIDKADFTYVLNPFNLSKDVVNQFQFPATLQPYDVISPLFNLLFGEEGKRLFSPVVRAVNESSISAKCKQRRDLILQQLQEFLISQNQNPDQQPDLSELEKYASYTEKDMTEKVTEDILRYYMKHLKLNEKFLDCWKDALLAGEQIMDISVVGGHPIARRVNTMEVNYLIPNNTSYIDEADKIYERNRMTVSEVVDEFYDVLSAQQLRDLETLKDGGTTFYNYYGGPTVGDYFGPTGPNNIGMVDSIYSFQDFSAGKGVEVHRVRWKSKKKIGSLTFIDERGEVDEIIVDEFYKPDKELGEEVKWMWINEYWEGVRIGQDMYLNVGPRKNQFRTIDNLSRCKSGYVGTLYNSLNSQSVSLMDREFPWVCLYLIMYYRLELLIAKNIGKIGLIDVSLIPDGWEIEKWMYYAQAMGFGFVNPYNQGLEGERRGKFNSSIQYAGQSMDLETGNSIQAVTNLIEYIKQQIKLTAGITDQRLGEISPTELVGNTERAVVQSSNITEEWFREHTAFKVRVCEALIQVAKECIGEDTKAFQYVTDDLTTVLFQVNGTDLLDTDLGVFVSNSPKDQEALQHLKQLMDVALQNDKANLSDVISVINSESIAEVKNKILQSEAKKEEQIAQSQQQELQTQKQLHDEEMFMRQQELDLQQYKIDQDNATKIQVQEIANYFKAAETDSDADGIPDPIEIGNLALDQQKHASESFLENERLKHEKEAKNKEFSLKEKELASKEKIEREKLIQIKEQNKNQLQLAEKKAKLDKEMMDKKMTIEKIKAKAAVQKAKQKPSKPKK